MWEEKTRGGGDEDAVTKHVAFRVMRKVYICYILINLNLSYWLLCRCWGPHPALPVSVPVEQGDVVEVWCLGLGLPRFDEPADVAVDSCSWRVLHGGGREGRPTPQLLWRSPQGTPLSRHQKDNTISLYGGQACLIRWKFWSICGGEAYKCVLSFARSTFWALVEIRWKVYSHAGLRAMRGCTCSFATEHSSTYSV